MQGTIDESKHKQLYTVLADQVYRDGVNGNINTLYTSQNLSNIVVAFVKAGYVVPKVFDTVAKKVCMYVCMYVCKYLYLYYIYMYVYMYLCMYVCIYDWIETVPLLYISILGYIPFHECNNWSIVIHL